MAGAGIGEFAEDAACTDYAEGSRHDVDDDGHDDDDDDGLDGQHCYHHQHYRKSYIISKTLQDIENPKFDKSKTNEDLNNRTIQHHHHVSGNCMASR